MHPDNNQDRIDFLTKEGINLIPVYVESRRDNQWINNNFFEKFKEDDYDFIVTGGNGQSEFPYNKLEKIKIIHTVHGTHPFNQHNIHKSVLLCDWQAKQWANNGGDASKIVIIPSVVYVPSEHTKTFRSKYDIPQNAFVYGLHQRNENGISSTVSLQAFSMLKGLNLHFAILGGSDVHRNFVSSMGMNNVTFADYTSNVNDIHDFLDGINVYAHCRTDGEVCSACIIEAMSHSKPVVSIPGINMGHADQLKGCGTIAYSVKEYHDEMEHLLDPAYYSMRSAQIGEKYQNEYDFKAVEKSILALID